MSARTARLSLIATLSTVDGLRVLVDPGQTVDPPAVVIVPPTLTYDVYGPGPSEAKFEVPLVVPGDDRAVESLEALLPAIQQAIYDSEDAALTDAQSGHWGNPPLPCYLLTIEVSV